MQPSAAPYILFAVVGVAAIFIDGRFIRRSGVTYLKEAYPDPKVADSLNRLITVLFHVAMLGILALLSVSPQGGSIEALVSRLGVLLLIIALAHGLTVWAFARMRSRQAGKLLQGEMTSRAEARLEGHDRLPPNPPANQDDPRA